MKYVGLQTQISRNNILSLLLLLVFPVGILGMMWVFVALKRAKQQAGAETAEFAVPGGDAKVIGPNRQRQKAQKQDQMGA